MVEPVKLNTAWINRISWDRLYRFCIFKFGISAGGTSSG